MLADSVPDSMPWRRPGPRSSISASPDTRWKTRRPVEIWSPSGVELHGHTTRTPVRQRPPGLRHYW